MKKLLLIPLLFVSACGLFFSPPDVALTEVKLITVDTSGANLDIYFQVHNSNSYDIILKGYSYDLKVLNLPLAKGGGRDKTVFREDSTTDLRIPVRVSYSDMTEILKHRPDLERIPYTVSAGFEIETPFGTRCFPVERSDTFAVPEEYKPSFYLKKFLDLFREKNETK